MFLSLRRLNHSAIPARSRASLSRAAGAAMAAVLLAIMLAPVVLAQNGRHWSPAASIDPGRLNGINTGFNDGCPIEAPDGHVLFFATNRAPGAGIDVWLAYRDADSGAWGDPEPLPAPVNAPAPANEFCPTPLPGNQLLFVSTRSNTCGGANNSDIYYTRLRMLPLGWTDPVPLPCAINSPFEEFSPSLVQSQGRTILFFSSNRDSGVAGVHKIYSSELLPDGTWTPAERIEALSSSMSDARPNVRADGREIVFDSNREGSYDIYVATRGRLDGPWSAPKRLSENVNSDTADEQRASLSKDGTRLYFGSTRANAELGGTGADIYVSTRSGGGHSK
jgi:hypothetical protein